VSKSQSSLLERCRRCAESRGKALIATNGGSFCVPAGLRGEAAASVLIRAACFGNHLKMISEMPGFRGDRSFSKSDSSCPLRIRAKAKSKHADSPEIIHFKNLEAPIPREFIARVLCVA